MTESCSVEVFGEIAMITFGRTLATRFRPVDTVFIQGDLGAGKTTLIRGILSGLGHDGPVPSPTYTLLEHYTVNAIDVVHMDLYRLKDPEELEMLGIRDFWGTCLCLIEWPERAGTYLPRPSWTIVIEGSGTSRRHIEITGGLNS